MTRKAYPTDLKDSEWKQLEALIPPAKHGGRKRTADMREVLNGIFYVVKTGCQWDMLPHDFPPKGTVYHYYNSWRKNGIWGQINAALREQVRQAEGRNRTPSAAILDSQSVKTTEKGAVGVMMQANTSKDASAISW
jgi:putative transposase